MIDFIDLSLIKELEGWQLDRALTETENLLTAVIQRVNELESQNASPDVLIEAHDNFYELAQCKGIIRAEITRRWPNGIPLGY